MGDSKKDKPGSPDCEKLVRAIMAGRNESAARRLEKILREKAAKRIRDVLGG